MATPSEHKRQDLLLKSQRIHSCQSSYANTKVTHIESSQIPEGDMQLQSSLYPYNIAVKSEQEGGEGVFMFPDVADFVVQRDGIFIYIERLGRGKIGGASGQCERVRIGTGRVPNTDIVAALVR